MVTTTLVHSQTPVSLKIKTPLEGTTFVVESLQGHETLSEPFEYTAHLVSTQSQISFQELVGQSISLSLECHDQTRWIHGLVGEMIQLNTARQNDDQATYYAAKVYPALWRLKFVRDCRIFQNQTALDIIKKVLTDNQIYDVKDLTQTHGQQTREYCVQYNESSLDFIHRLLEEEGIFYFFQHEETRHTLVLGDDTSAYPTCEAYEEASLESGQPQASFLGHITACYLKQHLVPQSYVLNDGNFTLAGTSLLSKSETQDEDGAKGEVYQYPGHYDHEDKPEKSRMEDLARLGLEKNQALQKEIEGSATIPFFLPGASFTLKGHPRSDANRTYTLYRVDHSCQMDPHHDLPPHKNGLTAEKGLVYHNIFRAFPADISYRPPSRTSKPRIYSTQTAVVTGPENEEIWTDQYGRVKVLFPWDRLSPHSEESSCWVRVAEAWAGNNWGLLVTPRIGMEVVVAFLEGDPDRPLIIGSVYNSQNMPPYLPEQPTKSTLKTKSTKQSEGFNEIRFEDLTGSEQVYLKAQKDRDFRTQETTTDWLEKGSAWLWIDQGNRETILGGGGEAVAKKTPKDQTLPAGAGDDNLTLTTGSKTLKLLGKGAHYTLIIPDGNRLVQLDQGVSRTLGKNLDTFYKSEKGDHETYLVQGNYRTILDEGDHETYLVKGDLTTGLTEGKMAQEVETGKMVLGVTTGDLMSVVETGMVGTSVTTGNLKNLIGEGDYILRVQQGNATTHLEQGNHTLEVTQGNQTIQLSQGNQTLEIVSGNRSITLGDGNLQHTINGSHTHQVTGNYTLTVEGNLTIVVTGNTTIQSEGNLTLSAAQNLSLSAGQNVTLSAGMSIQQEAGMNLTASAAMAMTLNADLEMTINALSVSQIVKVSYSVEAAVEATLTAGANLSLTAPLVSIA